MHKPACRSRPASSPVPPPPEDERATLVTITDNGLARFHRVLPGHIQVVRRLPFAPCPATICTTATTS